MKFFTIPLCFVLMIAPLAAQSSKDVRKTTEKQEATAGKKSGSDKSGGDKSAAREKIKASSGDEAGTAKGIVGSKK